MVINHNLSALQAHSYWAANNANASKAMQEISSGLRINSAADDAAGYAISQKMQSQINGLDQASSNAQDGISLVQTASGALNETQSILQRMRQLAVQSSSDTNTTQDRQNIQDEVNQLSNEIDNIRDTTQFNTKNLLDGSLAGGSTATANVNTSAQLTQGGAALSATSATLTALGDSNGKTFGIQSGNTIQISFTVDGTYETGSLTVTNGTKLSDISSVKLNGATSTTVSTFMTASVSGGTITETAATAGVDNAIDGLTLTVKDSSGNINTAATQGLSSFSETTEAADTHTDSSLTFQIGANNGQSITLGIDDMGTEALGIKGLDVTSADKANVAIKTLDHAIAKVSSESSKLGAYQNRLTDTISNLGTSSQNLQAASSQITDVDVASEMIEFSKDNILVQASQAMMAQANQLPQGVLNLLH